MRAKGRRKASWEHYSNKAQDSVGYHGDNTDEQGHICKGWARASMLRGPLELLSACQVVHCALISPQCLPPEVSKQNLLRKIVLRRYMCNFYYEYWLVLFSNFTETVIQC